MRTDRHGEAMAAFHNFSHALQYSRKHLRTDLCMSPSSFFLHNKQLRPKICPLPTQTLQNSCAPLSNFFADFSCKISSQPLCSKCMWRLAYCITLPCLCLFLTLQPLLAYSPSFTRSLDYTQRRNTVGTTPLDEWSARRRDFYLTTHNTHNRQTSVPPVWIEPKLSAGERPSLLM
jgi:hypothetical protein